jgi:hypothetical protein
MLNVGLQAVMHGQTERIRSQYMEVSSFWGKLRKYFHVNNKFVVKKLSVLLFPYIKKDWERSQTAEPPANDENSPDLYIPLMSLCTYVLTVGLAKGTSMTFDPEIIIDTFGTSLMVQGVQVALLRLGLTVLVPWVSTISWIEILAISGYQFVGVAVNMAIGLLFGHGFYMLSLLWTASSTAFVMTQTLRVTIPPPEPGQKGKRRRVNFLIGAAILQLLVMWFLGYTRELRAGGMILSRGVASASDVPINPMRAAPQNVDFDNSEGARTIEASEEQPVQPEVGIKAPIADRRAGSGGRPRKSTSGESTVV